MHVHPLGVDGQPVAGRAELDGRARSSRRSRDTCDWSAFAACSGGRSPYTRRRGAAAPRCGGVEQQQHQQRA
ncbi:hypothetical protein, partial [Micromonospora sp. WMMB482]|uniref:hypothetical protein n=1 Tax=Micromonospora sp. WMMB482 TaxID=2849653 RepID=UPI0020B3FAF5